MCQNGTENRVGDGEGSKRSEGRGCIHCTNCQIKSLKVKCKFKSKIQRFGQNERLTRSKISRDKDKEKRESERERTRGREGVQIKIDKSRLFRLFRAQLTQFKCTEMANERLNRSKAVK